MTGQINSPGVSEKNPLRDEISEQIRAYLQKGGEIEVIERKVKDSLPVADTRWSGIDDDIPTGG